MIEPPPWLARSLDMTPRADEIIEKPPGIEVFEEEDVFDRSSRRDEAPRGTLTLIRYWPRSTGVFNLLFTLLLGGVVAVVIEQGETRVGVFAMIGVFACAVVYIGIAHLLNRTTIRASRSTLTVRHGPLPWFGERTIPSEEVSHLSCRRILSGREEDKRFERRTASFTVDITTKDGKRRALVSSLKAAQEARYIHQRLSRHLRIDAKRGEAAASS